MLHELAVADLGVIDRVTLTIPPGMIALTGETGAGKTLLVDAISLLVGGRADPGLVRAGAKEAVVDGRFELNGEEIVLSRVVPAEGRSKAYVNGRPATAAHLAELGAKLVDLHGQHSHQSLLGVDAQRDALDTYGKVDLGPLLEIRAELAEIDAQLEALGGDERGPGPRARPDPLPGGGAGGPPPSTTPTRTPPWPPPRSCWPTPWPIRRRLRPCSTAWSTMRVPAIRSPGPSTCWRAAAPSPRVTNRLKALLAELGGRWRRHPHHDRPDRARPREELERVQARRRLLHDLCRKYGDDVAAVMVEQEALQGRLAELEDHDQVAADLDARRP